MKSLNRKGLTPHPPQGGAIYFCSLMEFVKRNSFWPPLGGQPRSGRGLPFSGQPPLLRRSGYAKAKAAAGGHTSLQ